MTVKRNRKLKRIAALAISLAMAMGTLPCTGIAADGFFADFENEDLSSFTLSKDGGATIGGNEDNHYLNISPKTDGTAAFAQYALACEENVPVNFSFMFKINSYMQSGQTIAHISKDGVPNIVIETYNGGLAYKSGSDSYVKFLDTAVANKWYAVSIKADYSKSTFSIRLDGEDIVKSVPNIGAAKGADKISFRAKYSPGISIDDFSASVTQNAGEIEVGGANEINLAYNTAGEFSYTVAVYDINDSEITSPTYTASVIPASSGITAEKDGRTVRLSVSDSAAEGDYTLRVIYGSAIKNFHITLSRYTAQAESLTLSGPGRIAYLEDKDNTYTFTATAHDQNGEEIDGVTINYFLSEGAPDNVSIDSQTGVLTVSGELTNNEKMTVMAECADNTGIYTSKKILLQDAATYEGDETRFRVLLDYIDRAREVGRDPYNGSILLAKAIDRYTMKPAIWNGLEYDFVPTNLAEQGHWFRTMQALYDLTGDEQYKREIDETYQLYLDNYVYESGAISMGGHICVDLQTLLPHHGYNSNTLELKSHFPYMDPFWEKDPEAARKFTIKFWDGAVTNWKTLAFNRHIKVYEPYSETAWKNLSAWQKPMGEEFSPVPSNGVSFRSTAADLISMAVELNRRTGDEYALEWSRRILENYYAATSKTTKLSAQIFNSRYKYTNNYTYEEMPEYWWLKPGLLTANQLSWYGDRFYVQYAEDLKDKGYITDLEMALEPYYRSSVEPDIFTAYADMELAEVYGFDSEYGDKILDYTLSSLKSLYTYGNYSVADNKVDQLLVDGTSLDGYISGRYGYYSSKGAVHERTSVNADFTIANLKTYLTCNDMEKYQDQLYYVWQFIRGDMAYNGFGEVGITGPGDSVKLDFSTTSSNPRYIIAFCWLYNETGNADYLEMARCVANNVVKSNMVDGLFTYQPSSHYIEIAGRNGIYPYAFVLLEATIRGEADLVPEYCYYDGYYEDRGILENTGERRTNLHDDSMWNRYNVTAVHITDIIVPEEEINLKVGEEKALNISFEPDDATNKSVRITSSDPACVSVDESAKSVVGIKPGSAEIYIISANNKLLRKTIKVTVE